MPNGKGCVHLCSTLRKTLFFTMGRNSTCKTLVSPAYFLKPDIDSETSEAPKGENKERTYIV
jgi:hypothetical protein